MLCKSCYDSGPWRCPGCGSTVKPPFEGQWLVIDPPEPPEPRPKASQGVKRTRAGRDDDPATSSSSSSGSTAKILMLHKGASPGSSQIQACPHALDGVVGVDEDEDDEYEEDEDDTLLEVHYLDVGMGDSTLIICPQSGYTVLIDCGSTLNQKVAGFEALKFVRARLLVLMDERNLDAPTIDRVYITHADRDHYNLLSALLHCRFEEDDEKPDIEVKEYFLGGSLKDYTAASADPFEKKTTVKQFKTFVKSAKSYPSSFEGEAPQALDDFVQVQVLCANEVPQHGETKVNASSLCILFSVTTEDPETEEKIIKKLLFMGDAEITVEEVLLENHKPLISNCCALKLGHHGAEAGSNAEFLKQVNPKFVYVSADMQWSHPYSSVVKRVLSLPSMNRTGPNDPRHSIVHGTGGTRKRAYVEQSISADFFTNLVTFSTDTSNSKKVKEAKKKGDRAVLAEGVQHTLFILQDGTVEIENSVSGESGRIAELK